MSASQTYATADAVANTLVRYSLAGLPVIPANIEKQSLVPWRGYQVKAAAVETVRGWLTSFPEIAAIGIVCGSEGNVGAFDFDDPTYFDKWYEQVQVVLGLEFAKSLMVERSGRTGGGVHIGFRTADRGDLAQTEIPANIPHPEKAGEWKSVIEFKGRKRGEEARGGAIIFVAPSRHKSGGCYQAVHRSWDDLPTVTKAEMHTMLEIARALDSDAHRREEQRKAEIETIARAARVQRPERKADSPSVIDAFNARWDIMDYLETRGYESCGSRMFRPGASSATPGVVIFDQICYSHSSGDKLNDGHAHDAFDCYRILEHGGDWTTATRNAAAMLGMTISRDASDDLDDWASRKPEPAAEAPAPMPLRIRSTANIEAETIEDAPVIVHGILRRKDVANLVASPKKRKSWLILDLAISVANGEKWMQYIPTNQGKVLLIDNELRETTIRKRIKTVIEARGIPKSKPFDYVSLREDGLCNINQLEKKLSAVTERYDLIIFDALYRFFPEKFDENSNADMTRLYNLISDLAMRTGAAILVVHHTSKGMQQGKSVTDVGSGAGAQSRAADAHIVLRDAGEGDSNVATMTAALRDFAPLEPLDVKWVYPLWVPASVSEVEQADPRRISTVETFVARYFTRLEQPSGEIEKKAKDDGMSRATFHRYLKQAIDTQLIDFKKEGKRVMYHQIGDSPF